MVVSIGGGRGLQWRWCRLEDDEVPRINVLPLSVKTKSEVEALVLIRRFVALVHVVLVSTCVLRVCSGQASIEFLGHG